MNLYLIGFMGSGKSTIGKSLSRSLHLPFIDLDYLIESNTRRKIQDIFSEDGEASFRIIEQQTLRTLIQSTESQIVACGGGTPCFFENMAEMNLHGFTVYLHLAADEIHQRLLLHPNDRPLIQNKEGKDLLIYIKEKLSEREKWYQQAKLIIDTGSSSVLTVTERILAHLPPTLFHP